MITRGCITTWCTCSLHAALLRSHGETMLALWWNFYKGNAMSSAAAEHFMTLWLWSFQNSFAISLRVQLTTTLNLAEILLIITSTAHRGLERVNYLRIQYGFQFRSFQSSILAMAWSTSPAIIVINGLCQPISQTSASPWGQGQWHKYCWFT